MQSSKQLNRNFLILTTTIVCKGKLSNGQGSPLSWPSSVLCRVQILLSTSWRYVIPVLKTGLIANLAPLRQLFRNKRSVLGIVLLVVGFGSIIAHQFLLDPYIEDHAVCRVLGVFAPQQCFSRITGEGWCYMSWFYYWETVRFCVAGVVWTVAIFCFIPAKFSLAFIPFSLIQGASWTGIFHYSFFANSFETYHAFPTVEFIAVGLCLGFGIVISFNYLLYWFNHKALGNWSRFVGVAEMKLSPEEKERMYSLLAKEYREIQKSI